MTKLNILLFSLKILGVVVTIFCGIAAVFSDTHDNGKLNKWGRTLIYGVAVGGVIACAVEVGQFIQDWRKDRETEAQTLKLLGQLKKQNSNIQLTLNQIKRVASRFETFDIAAAFDVSEESTGKEILVNYPFTSEQSVTELPINSINLSTAPARALGDTSLFIAIYKREVADYSLDEGLVPDLLLHRDEGETRYTVEGHSLILNRLTGNVTVLGSTGQINSFEDLPGCTVISKIVPNQNASDQAPNVANLFAQIPWRHIALRINNETIVIPKAYYKFPDQIRTGFSYEHLSHYEKVGDHYKLVFFKTMLNPSSRPVQ
jgi:hypothetical protein